MVGVGALRRPDAAAQRPYHIIVTLSVLKYRIERASLSPLV
jgi:hypothetical protein